MIALEAGAMILALVGIALIILLDDPEDLGKLSDGWVRRDRERRR